MRRLIVLVIVLLALGVHVLSAQEGDGSESPDLFSGERALEHAANHVGVGPRPVATINSYRAGDLILSYLGDLGWETSEDWHLIDFGPTAELSEAARQTIEDWQPINLGTAIDDTLAGLAGDVGDRFAPAFDSLVIPVRNLVASYGDGPTIIIGAHYDSRIYSDQDGDPARRTEPMPGANDGGSGVGVLLELARVISENYDSNAEIRLVFFDAEDNGRIEPFPQLSNGFANGYLVGSTLYANSLNLNEETIQYMLLVDMVGDMEQRFPIEGYSAQYAPDIANAIWSVAADLGYGEQFPQEVRSPVVDDHVPFLQRSIPAVDVIDLDYPYWHTSQDTLDNVSAESLERVGRVLIAYLEQSGVLIPKAD